jgi:hypothetical protein
MARTAGSHSDITGPRVAEAALRLFARHGYAAVSMRQIAAEVGLLSGDTYHFWFPIYDRDFARFSPGALLSYETLSVLAEEGVSFADFGPGAESYKRVFADPGPDVLEGDIHIDPFITGLREMVRHAREVGSPALRAMTFHDRAAALKACVLSSELNL